MRALLDKGVPTRALIHEDRRAIEGLDADVVSKRSILPVSGTWSRLICIAEPAASAEPAGLITESHMTDCIAGYPAPTTLARSSSGQGGLWRPGHCQDWHSLSGRRLTSFPVPVHITGGTANTSLITHLDARRCCPGCGNTSFRTTFSPAVGNFSKA